jgi:hypothetical protein
MQTLWSAVALSTLEIMQELMPFNTTLFIPFHVVNRSIIASIILLFSKIRVYDLSQFRVCAETFNPLFSKTPPGWDRHIALPIFTAVTNHKMTRTKIYPQAGFEPTLPTLKRSKTAQTLWSAVHLFVVRNWIWGEKDGRSSEGTELLKRRWKQETNVTFKILTAACMKMAVFRFVAPWCSDDRNSKRLWNVGKNSTTLHDATIQKTAIIWKQNVTMIF